MKLKLHQYNYHYIREIIAYELNKYNTIINKFITYGFCSVGYNSDGGSNNSPECSLQSITSLTIAFGLGSLDGFL